MPAWQAALSIAAAWVWAPAVFICSMQSFTKGVPGVFWFTAPNILCFFVFALIATRLRKLVPHGYTVPHYISEKRFAGERGVHLAYTTVFIGYRLGAVIINSLAGGALLNSVSGLDTSIATVCVALIALSS